MEDTSSAQSAQEIEIVALAVLRHAVRGRECGRGPVTFRRALPDVVPGYRLSVAVRNR